MLGLQGQTAPHREQALGQGKALYEKPDACAGRMKNSIIEQQQDLFGDQLPLRSDPKPARNYHLSRRSVGDLSRRRKMPEAAPTTPQPSRSAAGDGTHFRRLVRVYDVAHIDARWARVIRRRLRVADHEQGAGAWNERNR